MELPTGPPEAVNDCRLIQNQSMSSNSSSTQVPSPPSSSTTSDTSQFILSCKSGYDGGLNQSFHLEVYYDDPNDELLVFSAKNNFVPKFTLSSKFVPSLVNRDQNKDHDVYVFVIYSTNSVGQSPKVILKSSDFIESQAKDVFRIRPIGTNPTAHIDTSRHKPQNTQQKTDHSSSRTANINTTIMISRTSGEIIESVSDTPYKTGSSSSSSHSSQHHQTGSSAFSLFGLTTVTFIGIISGLLLVLVIVISITSFILVRKVNHSQSETRGFITSDDDQHPASTINHQDDDDLHSNRLLQFASGIDSRGTNDSSSQSSSTVVMNSCIKSGSINGSCISKSGSKSKRRQPISVTFATNENPYTQSGHHQQSPQKSNHLMVVNNSSRPSPSSASTSNSLYVIRSISTTAI